MVHTRGLFPFVSPCAIIMNNTGKDRSYDTRRESFMTHGPVTTKGAVVITGASTGIGMACAFYMDRLGYHVFAGIRNEGDERSLIKGSAGRITPLLIEVTDSASVAAAADRVAKAVGSAGLSGLVNNAGIVVAGPLEFLPLSEIRKQLEVNVLGQITVTQAFLPLLRQARGRIVNMSSIAGRVAFPYIGPYSASKYAFEAISDALRIELLPWGISVSVVEPGDVATPIWKKSTTAAQVTARSFPSQAEDLYGQSLKAVTQASERAAASAFDPVHVVRAVEHALTAVNPKTRYLVGPGVRLRAILKKILSDRLLDQLIVRHIGLPGKPRDGQGGQSINK
jgi:NAD(P)-dependent dehydrogenase (short-subunit alcohol dehydrogenase family)